MNFKPIVPPHTHPLSLDSGNSVKQFIKASAKTFGHKAIAITDHGTMGAIIEAYEYSKELKKKEGLDITIIPGIELYLKPDETDPTRDRRNGKPVSYYHVTCHFNNFQSYLKCCELTKKGYERGLWKGSEYKPLITWDELESLSGQVTLFSSCLIGAVLGPWINGSKEQSEQNFVRLKNIAGPEKFFVEIFPYEVSKDWDKKDMVFKTKPSSCDCPNGMMQVGANEWVMHLAEKYNVPMVASEDAHYANPDDKAIQDARLSNGKEQWKMADVNCLHTSDWLFAEFNRLHIGKFSESQFQEIIENSYKFADQSKGFSPHFKPALPLYPLELEAGMNEDNQQAKHVVNLIQKKGRVDFSNDIYRNRLNKELKELAFNGKINILPYFLTLHTVIEHCEKNNILVGPGRGSAAGSLLAYGLGITNVDPIKEDLSFERFFDVTRVEEGLADIDTDFSDRDAVIEFAKKEWGDRFAYIGVAQKFKTKMALKDIDRFLNGEVSKLTEDVAKSVGNSPQGVDEERFLNGYTDQDGNTVDGELDTNPKLLRYLQEHPKNAALLFKMIGITRQMGRHACGVIIADRPVHEFIPLMKVKGELITQLTPEWVQKCGGVKYDFLGLNTLLDVQKCVRLIKERTGKVIDPWKIEDTPEIWEAAANNPSTIFQLHTQTVRHGLQTMRPKNVTEGAILTSIFRPGATDAVSDEDPNKTMADIFLERWTGQRETKYIHPDLIPYLSVTKGVITWQEQIMKIVHELGGLTMVETQKVRKSISKKVSDDLINSLNKVEKHLVEVRGWTKEQANSLTSQMKASGRYSFNKSHAISYIYIARACAYLKYHYPLEWWTAVLSNADKEDLKGYWKHVSKFVRFPDVNKSNDSFEISSEGGVEFIRAPLSLLEGIGAAALAEITSKRPFVDFRDFITRIDRRVINKRAVANLIFSNSLDSLFTTDRTDEEKYAEYLNLRAEIAGTTREAFPQEYMNLTPLKRYLLKKTILTVYSDDLFDIALPKLIAEKMVEIDQNGIYKYLDTSGKFTIANSNTFKIFTDANNPAEANFAVIGMIQDEKEFIYQKTKKALKLSVELDDLTFETVKWPKWGSDHHDEEKVKNTICVLILNRKGGTGRDKVFVKKIIPIERGIE
jgi:DNA polymerase-3 subunit alpha